MFTGNPFVAISTSAPPSIFPSRQHPLKPFDVDWNVDNKPLPFKPIPTSTFYGNILLADRTLCSFPDPYSVWWSRINDFYGLAVSQVTSSQKVFGPDGANPPTYYFNPVGIMSVNLGAKEFANNNIKMEADTFRPFSVNLNLLTTSRSGKMWCPLAYGMGFVTASFFNLTPVVSSQVGFQTVKQLSTLSNGIRKYQLTLFNGVTWLMYVTIPSGQQANFSLKDNNHFVSSSVAQGVVVQVCSAPSGSESYYDKCAGIFVIGASIGGEITNNGGSGVYRIQYEVNGKSLSGKPLIFARPHHVESFTAQMPPKLTPIKLSSLVCGTMVAYITTVLEMQETSLPNNIGFLPWTSIGKSEAAASSTNPAKSISDELHSAKSYPSSVLSLLRSTANSEMNQDLNAQTNLNSMYFSGKGLDKFALILFVIKYIVKDDTMAKSLLSKLKSAFSVFTSNKQIYPLCYDATWKGIISTGGLGEDRMQDFGNSYYNDHHFHYGYFVHTAAIIGQVDADFGGDWAQTNKPFINSLIRDVANPDGKVDLYFPESRAFDWFCGHSWAHGLFASADGKDEESSSEDYHFFYGMKLWARVIHDGPMEGRANMILAVTRRALNKYMLYQNNNTVEPAKFIPNKVSGIMFENKIDHATFFGLNPEFIHGIHMIPITSISSYIRNPTFVKEEWNAKLAGIINNVDSGWRGVLKLNQALYDPNTSAAFFQQNGFPSKWLDPGLSLTWAIAYSAAF